MMIMIMKELHLKLKLQSGNWRLWSLEQSPYGMVLTGGSRGYKHIKIVKRWLHLNKATLSVAPWTVTRLPDRQVFWASITDYKRQHTHSLTKSRQLHWLLIRQRVNHKLTTLTYKILHTGQPVISMDWLISMNLFISFVRLVRDYCIVIDLELFSLYVVLNITQ